MLPRGTCRETWSNTLSAGVAFAQAVGSNGEFHAVMLLESWTLLSKKTVNSAGRPFNVRMRSNDCFSPHLPEGKPGRCGFFSRRGRADL